MTTSSPFGASPPAPPAAAASTPVDQSAGRSRALVLGGAGCAALLLVAGAAVVLTGGEPVDDVAPVPPATVTVPAAPAPEAIVPAALPREPYAARNPFVPLVTDPAAAANAATDTAAAGGAEGTAGTGVDGGAPTGSGRTGSSGTGSTRTGSTATSSTNGAPATAPAVDPVGVDETCKAADDIWNDYIDTMADPALTETMAGHEIGIQIDKIERLAESTAVAALRQPLGAWSLEMGEVRALLVGKAAVRPLKPVPENRPAPVYNQPDPGVLPLVDEAEVLTARTSQRERCFQLIDPLVTPEEF